MEEMGGRLDPHSDDVGSAREEAPEVDVSGRWRRAWQSRVIRAWVAVILWAAMIWTLGGDSLSASSTAGVLRPLIEWFRPDFTPAEMYSLLVTIRKLSHVAEYGLLAMLVLRALWIGSIESIVTSLGFTVLLVGLLALADETRQAYSLERTGSSRDVGLDLGGAAIVALAMLTLRAVLGRPLFTRETRERDPR
jgi:VanZ family protein